jgi:hypothetical protein
VPIQPENVWLEEFDKLEKTNTPAWSVTMANWYADMITGIQPDPTIFTAVGFTFTFNPSVFATAMAAAAPSVDPFAGVSIIANAWESAMLAAIVVCGPGSILLPPSPATTFSVVSTTIIDIPSITLGKTSLLGLATAPQTNKGTDSQYPKKLREATLSLTITVSGLNSITPTPAPFVASSVPLI